MLDKTLLKRFRLFEGAGDAALTALGNCGEEIDLKAGNTLYRAGDRSEHLYGILDGAVELSLVFEEKILKPAIKYEDINESRFEILKKPIQVALAGDGHICGWSALVKSRRRTLTAVCTRDGRAIALSADRLNALFEKEPALGYTVMRELCDLVYTHLEKRTEKLIEAWGQAFGTAEIRP